jgi:hypothetical protein
VEEQMIEPAIFEVETDNVIVFDKTVLPQGSYMGAVEWIEIPLHGYEKRQMARAMVQVDRKVLENLGEKISPNLLAVDFDLLKYVKSGDVRIVN